MKNRKPNYSNKDQVAIKLHQRNKKGKRSNQTWFEATANKQQRAARSHYRQAKQLAMAQ